MPHYFITNAIYRGKMASLPLLLYTSKYCTQIYFQDREKLMDRFANRLQVF